MSNDKRTLSYILIFLLGIFVTVGGIYVYKDEIKLSNETAKTTLLYDGVYHIDYLDLETLTHQFYAISNNIHVS